MNPRVCAQLQSTMLLAVGLLVSPFSLLAQDECEFEGSGPASEAQEAFQKITAESTEEEKFAANTEAIEALSSQLGGDDPITLLFAAQALIGLGDYDEARRHLDHYDEVAPPECEQYGQDQRYGAWVRLYNTAVSAYSSGQNDEALETFLLANEFQLNLISINNAALLQIEMGDNLAAIETYETALAADIPDADPDQLRDVIRGLGDLLSEEGRSDEARTAYEEYLNNYPDDVVIGLSYAGLLAEEDPGESENIYNQIMGRSDLSSAQWVEVGVGFYNVSNYGDAAIAFGNARTSNPYNKEGMENFVNASVQAGRPGPVMALADTLVKWYPYDASNYQLYASVLARADMDDRAMVVIDDGQTTDLVFHFVQMAASNDGVYVVQGSLEARNATGQVTIPFEFLDVTGRVVMTEVLSVEAPPSGQTETFRMEVRATVPLAGFRYKKIGT